MKVGQPNLLSIPRYLHAAAVDSGRHATFFTNLADNALRPGSQEEFEERQGQSQPYLHHAQVCDRDSTTEKGVCFIPSLRHIEG